MLSRLRDGVGSRNQGATIKTYARYASFPPTNVWRGRGEVPQALYECQRDSTFSGNLENFRMTEVVLDYLFCIGNGSFIKTGRRQNVECIA